MDTNTKRDRLPFFLSGIVAALVLFLAFVLYNLTSLQSQVKQQQNAIENNSKVYVYSLEDLLQKMNVLAEKQKFETEIINLNSELLDAEKKIKSLKDAKVKADFSDVYLKNLRMKRDELVLGYENKIKALTDTINQALSEVAAEKSIGVIFVKSAVALNTPAVVDLTDEIYAKIK